LRILPRAQGENPLTLLNGLGNLSRNFTIAWADGKTDDQGNYRLVLSPRRNSQLVQSMEVLVSQKAVAAWRQRQQSGTIFPLLATEVTDQQGNRTRITFHQVKIVDDFAASLFQFQPPADVEVVTPEDLRF
jgi:outer membrane lipoprotein carrier protein